MKLFLTGAPGVGKSTLLSRLIDAAGVSPRGFFTKKEAAVSDGRTPIYIRSAVPGDPFGKRLVGLTSLSGSERFPAAFDGATELLTGIPEGSLVVMDELGFLESGAELFKAGVLELLYGDYDVLGVIKPRQTAFLDAVRAVPGVEVFQVTPGNRDELIVSLERRVKEYFEELIS